MRWTLCGLAICAMLLLAWCAGCSSDNPTTGSGTTYPTPTTNNTTGSGTTSPTPTTP